MTKSFVSIFFLFSFTFSQSFAFGLDQKEGSGTSPNTLYTIKGIWTDFWGNRHHPHPNAHFDRDEIAKSGTGKVAVNLVWVEWDMAGTAPPGDAGHERYENEYFKINPIVDDEIKFYSDRNIEVTAVIFGTPARFRVPGCVIDGRMPGKSLFHAPDTKEGLAAFGRFVGMLAHRYDGTRGNGRIKNFVIGNEVNRAEWYHFGENCPRSSIGTQEWIESYANYFKAAYDAIQRKQLTAKVFVSLDHAFSASRWDRPSRDSRGEPSLSTQTFLTEFAKRMQGRTWRVAYHPYNTDLFSPTFDPNDAALSGNITMGNIGMLPGWLRKAFPNDSQVYGDILLTESGFHSGPPSSEQAQADALSRSFRNVLGTPGITGYIYQRMMDHSGEGGLWLGLRRGDGTPKPSWLIWARMNRPGVNLDSGFEQLPFTQLTRGVHPGKGHWVSSRLLPPDFVEEISWKLLRAPSPALATRMLYECGSGTRTFLSTEYNCEGQEPRGPVGYAYTRPERGLVPLYRCYNPTSGDYLISSNENGEGEWRVEKLLGYAYPSAATTPFLERDPSVLLVIPDPVAQLNPPPSA